MPSIHDKDDDLDESLATKGKKKEFFEMKKFAEFTGKASDSLSKLFTEADELISKFFTTNGNGSPSPPAEPVE